MEKLAASTLTNPASTGEEVLPMDPPPVVARLTASLLILIFFAALAFSVLVPIPETVRCRFVLVSEEGSDPIQSRLFAVIQEINIKEGDEVVEGEVLFKLRSDEIRNWRTELNRSTNELAALRERRPNTEISHRQQTNILGGMVANATRDIEYNEKLLKNRGALRERMVKLNAERIISDEEKEAAELNEQLAVINLDVAKKKSALIQLEIEKLVTDRARERTTEDADEIRLVDRIAALTVQLENCEDDLMIIRAPYHAVVIELPSRNRGSVVDEGDELCQLARDDDDDPVVARLHLNEDGFPRIYPNLPVRYFFDAFPYQRYGTVEGELEWISPAAVATPEGTRFIAGSTLSTNKLWVVPSMVRANGIVENLDVRIPRPLHIGMKGEARINVGTRTLLEFAIEPFRGVKEEMKAYSYDGIPIEEKTGGAAP